MSNRISSITEYEKSQLIRLVDVFVLAPYLIYAANRFPMPKIHKQIITTIGVATLIYNGNNYLKNERENNKVQK